MLGNTIKVLIKSNITTEENMSRDDVIRLAREAAGGMLSYDEEGNWRLSEDEVLRFAELVKQHVQIEQMPKFEELAKTVREDCAQMVEEYTEDKLLAFAIRKRK